MRKVFVPRTLSELWDCLDEASRGGASPDDGSVSVYAGGTDLLVKMRSGLIHPSTLVCLDRIGELKEIAEEGDEVRMGACATHARLLRHPSIAEHFTVLAQALRGLGSPLIRNMGTIGGNLCTASPAGDTLPPLYVLDARVELLSRRGRRSVPVGDFILGPGRTSLETGEILAAVRVEKPRAPEGGCLVHHFEKVGHRNALACSVASLAALLRLSSPGGVVEKAALAWGSVAPTVVVCPEARRALEGNRLSLEKLREAAVLAREAVDPVTDVRADAEYRRVVSGNLLLRLLCAE